MMQGKTIYCFAALIFAAGSVMRLAGDTSVISAEHEMLLLAVMPFAMLLTAGFFGIVSAPVLSAFCGYAISDMVYALAGGMAGFSMGELIILCLFVLPSVFLCVRCCTDISLRLIGTVFFGRHIDMQPAGERTAVGLVSAVISFSVYIFGIK